jgi:hypothetical protein
MSQLAAAASATSSLVRDALVADQEFAVDREHDQTDFPFAVVRNGLGNATYEKPKTPCAHILRTFKAFQRVGLA